MRGCECRTSSKSRPFQNLTRLRIRLATNRSKYRIRAVEATRFSRWRSRSMPCAPFATFAGRLPPRANISVSMRTGSASASDGSWSRAPASRALLVSSPFPAVSEAGEIPILLQRHSTDGGDTDVELNAANRFHAILGAKRFWTLPGETQLRRYGTKSSQHVLEHPRDVVVIAIVGKTA